MSMHMLMYLERNKGFRFHLCCCCFTCEFLSMPNGYEWYRLVILNRLVT